MSQFNEWGENFPTMSLPLYSSTKSPFREDNIQITFVPDEQIMSQQNTTLP